MRTKTCTLWWIAILHYMQATHDLLVIPRVAVRQRTILFPTEAGYCPCSRARGKFAHTGGDAGLHHIDAASDDN
jgi:hypothetical protein